jgi:hypothetical protein
VQEQNTLLHHATAWMLRCMKLRAAAVMSLSPLWLIAALQTPPSCTGGPTGTGGASGTAGTTSRTACKRGVAYGFDPAGAVSDLRALSPSVSWFYNWSSRPPAPLLGEYERLGGEFVPMLWNASFNVDDVVNRIPAGAKYLLGFNEPNFHSQANLTPEQAAAAWPRVEEVARRRGLTLVSPAVNYCGGGCNATDPVDWLDRFFAACTGCRVDHVAVHWYACYGSALSWYIGRFKKYGRPIWLTEFSCGDEGVQPVSRQQSYMKDALAYLEGDPDVFRYSWFSGRTTAIANVDLLGSAGALTTLGRDYVSLPSPAVCRQ